MKELDTEKGGIDNEIRDFVNTWRVLNEDCKHLEELEELKRIELRKERAALALCQLNCLQRLKEIYPITVLGDYDVICGLGCPHDLVNLDDEQLSAALGYICHLTILLAKYLMVNLRYQLSFHASRSLVYDSLSAADGTVLIYPLFRKEVDRRKFEIGMQFLQANIQQLLWVRGVPPTNGSMLADLKRLYDLEIDRLSAFVQEQDDDV
mmetsp:Transcript_22116/g.28641  ORF Transcript_22116/g.28641 Transcript_22116/m.28641 type:complete len:208 (-) Transcript_22116:70-693(-)